MANQEQLDILKQGVEVWNQWRKEHAGVKINLSGAYLSGADLSGADLRKADLDQADLDQANLRGANLSQTTFVRSNLYLTDFTGANLSMADLRKANLFMAILNFANLTGASLIATDLHEADFIKANFFGANFFGANFNASWFDRTNFTQARVGSTIFGNVDLSSAKGLDTIEHRGPSTIGIDTIIRSQGKIPEIFLRRAGVPDSIITMIPSLVGSLNPNNFYSCFISYSSKDQDFAERLYADLHNKGVRCWFAPEDMDIGDKIRPRIEESIGHYDKLLLVLSEHSITSTWVAYEVERALNKEPAGIPNVLYPIRLDDAVMKFQTGWATDIKRTRHIGDFTHWKNHEDYQKAFNRLLRALKAEA